MRILTSIIEHFVQGIQNKANFDRNILDNLLYPVLNDRGNLVCPVCFMPPDRMIGGILSLSCLSVCLSICLLSTLTFAITLEP